MDHFIKNFIKEGFQLQDLSQDITNNILKCLEYLKKSINILPIGVELIIQTRQGGKDAQNLSQLLLQMYINFFSKHNINFQLIDISYAETGIHQANILARGHFALIIALLLENGLHRIERYSPYNAQNKKQTSHIQIYVNLLFPSQQIQIKPSELEITPVKASGPGGQYVNKTLSGIMIKHIPTGLYVKSTQFRSQQANRKFALDLLKSKIIEYQEERNKTESRNSSLLTLKPKDSTNIRTYDFIDNKIRNQYIKYKLPNTKKISEGNIEPLLMYNILYALRKTCDKII